MADETEKEKPDPKKTKRKWHEIISDAVLPGKSLIDSATKKMNEAQKKREK
jgi:hypothetical protein